ncbi:TlpA family protein disulfide reductase [Mucilaginibacter lappiensis]|uniref:Peroxiredoxin n=1 Tax=Mucilaginibacter lappiensis TaxID=354630 RepID=A0A841JG20_9SPHI|nr:TlpA disulfide reductase family protein [Mucilaginibacter lappiensis]MBB6126981.1 peroxiredoxin [Mucilaginibacter lappiensis]
MKPKSVIQPMKNIYLILLLLTASFAVCAQDTVKKAVTTRFKIDTHTVVKDSTGKAYAFKEWIALTRTGEYILRPDDMNNANTTFTLIKKGNIPPKYLTAVHSGGTVAAGQKNLSPEEAEEQRMASYPKPKESENFTIGQQIETFNTTDMHGKKVKLKDLRGKVVMLNFWFIGCPPCMQEIPELNKLVELYKDNPNVVFLAISLDPRWDIRTFLKTTPFNFDIIDDGSLIARIYKIHLYPTSVILDKEGKVAFHTVSFAANSPYWMKKTINEALK